MLNEKQASFIISIVEGDNRFNYLLGDGGTGKTFTIHHLLEQYSSRVKLCAYSTVAAKELHSSAQTVHATIGLRIDNFGMANNKKVEKIETIQHRVVSLIGYTLIVDEMSMINQEMLDLILATKADKYIFVGDDKQIPPINGTHAKFPVGCTTILTENYRASNADIKTFVSNIVDSGQAIKSYADTHLKTVSNEVSKTLIDEMDYTYIAYTNSSILGMSTSMLNTKEVYCKTAHVKGYFAFIDGRKNKKLQGVSIRLLARNEDTRIADDYSDRWEIRFKSTKELVEWSKGERIVYDETTQDAIIDIINGYDEDMVVDDKHLIIGGVHSWADAVNNDAFEIAQIQLLGKHTYVIKISDDMFMVKYKFDLYIDDIQNYIENALFEVEQDSKRAKLSGLLNAIHYFDNSPIRDKIILNIEGKSMEYPNYPNPKSHDHIYIKAREARVALQAELIKYVKHILPITYAVDKRFKHRADGYNLHHFLNTLNNKSDATHRLHKAITALYFLNGQFRQIISFIDSRCRTADACQGRSISKTVIDLKGMSDKRAYVALTRARDKMVLTEQDKYTKKETLEEGILI